MEKYLGPDDKSSHVCTRGELQKVQAIDVTSVDTRQVTESLDNAVILLVDDERACKRLIIRERDGS